MSANVIQATSSLATFKEEGGEDTVSMILALYLGHTEMASESSSGPR